MKFKNIRRASRKELDEQTKRTAAEVKALKSVCSNYNYERMLTKTQRTKTEAEKKAIIINKIETSAAKKWAIIDDKITRIENAADLLGLSLSVEWKSNRIWGANPRATARIHTAAGGEYYESRSIGGCGYDKESTATAEALNQSASVLKELYKVYEKALKTNKAATPEIILGYGSGYGCRPYFAGGCGVSCCYDIFKSIGFTFESIASGKMFSVYQATKVDKQ